jgi:CheY-like chemotaxis protein
VKGDEMGQEARAMAPGDATTLLVVDDEIDMRLLVRAVMDIAGNRFEIVGEASDGVEAVERWRDLKGPPMPHVVILDNRMPNRSGLEVAEEILAERPEQQIVLFSAFLDDSVRAQAKALGISACLTKEDVAQLPDLILGLGD